MLKEDKVFSYPSQNKPWLKYYFQRKEVVLSKDETLYGHFRRIAKKQTNKLAYIDYNTKQTMTFGAMLQEVDSFADGLNKMGITAGSIIGVLSFLSSVDPIALLGANKIGAALKFVNPDSGVEGMRKGIEGLDLLVLEDIFQQAESVLNPLMLPVVLYGNCLEGLRGNCIRYSEFIRNGSTVEYNPASYSECRPSLIIYSSGSTGEAKPIVHSDRTILAAVEKMLNADYPIQPGNLLLQAIPSHIGLGSITTMVTALLSGVGFIQIKGMPDPASGLANETVSLIKEYKSFLKAIGLSSDMGLLLFAAPYFASYILRAIGEIEDLSFVKGILLGGAKMEQSDVEKMETAFRAKGLTVPVCNGYGQNEQGGAVALNTVHYNKNGSAGYPVYHTDIRIVDRDSLEEKPFYQEGLILERSESEFLRYYNMPEKTAASKIVLPDGSVWYDSTDIGYMDEDGYIFITGRTTRVVLRVDHKISLDLIEEKLTRLPNVKEAAVVTTQNGKELVAFIGSDHELMEDDWMKTIKEEQTFSVFEYPTKVMVKKQLPRMQNGKIDYKRLEQETKDSIIE